MNTSRALRAVAGYAVMVAAIGLAVTVFMVADVQLASARIDPENEATWPHMAPQVRYFFIPVIAGVIALAALVVNVLLSLIDRRRIERLTHWGLLGVAYGLAASPFLVRNLGLSGKIVLFAGPSIALACVVLVRWRYGVKGQRNAV